MTKFAFNVALLSVMGTAGINAAHAEMVAMPMPADTRLVVFPYDPHNTYQILTKPKAVTDIQFHGEERIKAVALGDTVQWETAKTADGTHLFIKPKFENIDTSATVVTDRRSYQLLLKSTRENGKWYQRVSWEYPELLMMQESLQVAAVEEKRVEEKRQASQTVSSGMALENLNFNYQIDGDAPFRPSGVLDDGKFTFLKMPAASQEMPALFLLPADGAEPELINYVIRGDYLVVQRLIDRVLLKIGKQEVRVSRQEKSKGFFGLSFK